VRREDFKFLQGCELITTFESPVRETPPGYRSCFCGRCGSPVPDDSGDSPWFEIPAGLLDDDPRLRPDKHIFFDVKAHWFSITDDLPQLDEATLLKLRRPSRPPNS
jgi:hypothetical protein